MDSEIRDAIHFRRLNKAPMLIREGYVKTGLRFLCEFDPRAGVRECERAIAVASAKGETDKVKALNEILAFGREELRALIVRENTIIETGA